MYRIHATRPLILAAACLVAMPIPIDGAETVANLDKPRVIVLTDITNEPDDEESADGEVTS